MFNREKFKADRSFSRYSQRVSDISSQHLTFDGSKDHDVLLQFRTYKSKHKSKHSSPIRSDFSYSVSPQKREARSSMDFRPSETNTRPGSAPYDFNILRAARLIEITPPNHNISQNSSQDKSNERLYRGARIVNKSSREQDSSLFKLAEVVCNEKEIEAENELIKKEKHECSAFIDSLNYMKELRFDLELNFDIVRGNDSIYETGMLGNFFKLEEKLKNYDLLSMKHMKKYRDQDFIVMLKDYSRILRDTLRAIKSKGGDDEAVMVEMLWRAIVKVYDSSLSLHENHLQEAIENAKSKVRDILEESQKKIKLLEDTLLETKERLEGEIQKNRDYIKSLIQANGELEREVIIRDHRIGELTEMDSRDVSCVEMSRIFKKLNQYITESEDQQQKQVATLVSISQVMTLAEELDEKPAMIEGEAQTKYIIPDSRLPELEFPIVSLNPFYTLFKENQIKLTTDDAFDTCKLVLDSCNLEINFHRKLAEYISQNNNRENSKLFLLKIMNTTYQSKTIKGILYSYLLGYPKMLPFAAEQILFRLNQIIPNPEPNSPEGGIYLFKLLECLSHYAILRKPTERILSKISYTCVSLNNNEIPKQIFVLLSRFQLVLEKSKKSIKAQIESQDFKKEGTCNFISE